MIILSCVGYIDKRASLCKVLLHGASRGAGKGPVLHLMGTQTPGDALFPNGSAGTLPFALASSSKFASLCARLIPPATRSCTYGSSSAWNRFSR